MREREREMQKAWHGRFVAGSSGAVARTGKGEWRGSEYGQFELACGCCGCVMDVTKDWDSGVTVRNACVSCALCVAVSLWWDIQEFQHALHSTPELQAWAAWAQKQPRRSHDSSNGDQGGSHDNDEGYRKKMDRISKFWRDLQRVHGLVFPAEYRLHDPGFPRFSSTDFTVFKRWFYAVLATVRCDPVHLARLRWTLLEHLHAQTLREKRCVLEDIEVAHAAEIRGFRNIMHKFHTLQLQIAQCQHHRHRHGPRRRDMKNHANDTDDTDDADDDSDSNGDEGDGCQEEQEDEEDEAMNEKGAKCGAEDKRELLDKLKERQVSKIERWRKTYAKFVEKWEAAQEAVRIVEEETGVASAKREFTGSKENAQSRLIDGGWELEQLVVDLVLMHVRADPEYDPQRYEYILSAGVDLARVCQIQTPEKSKAEFDYVVFRRDKETATTATKSEREEEGDATDEVTAGGWFSWLIFEIKSSCGAIAADSIKFEKMLAFLSMNPFAGMRPIVLRIPGQRPKTGSQHLLETLEREETHGGEHVTIELHRNCFQQTLGSEADRKKHMRYMAEHPWGRSQVGISGGDRRRFMLAVFQDIRACLLLPGLFRHPSTHSGFAALCDPFDAPEEERVRMREEFVRHLFDSVLPRVCKMPESERTAAVADLHQHGAILFFQHLFLLRTPEDCHLEDDA
eukprot:ANDGO_02475.mRNA.1 hypothetical protein